MQPATHKLLPVNQTLSEYIATVGDNSGTVTKVVTQSKRRDRVSIFIDGVFAFGVSDEVALANGLTVGAAVDATKLAAVDRSDQTHSCKRIALRFISYRMRSEQEVRRRLAKEGAPAEISAAVIAQLRDLNFLDDGAFAKAFARDSALGKKWGPHRIAQKLREAGVGDHHIEEALKEVRNTMEDEDLVRVLAEKRWAQLSRIDDAKKRKKRLYDYLARRGFDFDDIRRVVDSLSR